jgi:hypothetical protein
MEKVDKFEEYRLLYERAEKLSERRQTTSQIYLTINTAIFGGVAFLAKDSGFQGWILTLSFLSLFAFGILVCSIWLSILLKLEKILNWQYGQLREMEKGIPGSFQLFTKENDALYKPNKGEEKFSFSLLEARLPAILVTIYGICVLGIIFAAWIGGM